MSEKITSHLLGKLRDLKAFIEVNFSDLKKINSFMVENKIGYRQQCVFKDVFGVSVSDYRAKIRMDNARKILIETDAPLKAICGLIGYRSMRSFIYAFRMYTSMNPHEFRKSLTVSEIKKLPEDVFTREELEEWAIRNGFCK